MLSSKRDSTCPASRGRGEITLLPLPALPSPLLIHTPRSLPRLTIEQQQPLHRASREDPPTSTFADLPEPPSRHASLSDQLPLLPAGVGDAGVASVLHPRPRRFPSAQSAISCCSFSVARKPRDAAFSTHRTLGTAWECFRGCCYKGQEGSPCGVNATLPHTRVRAPVGSTGSFRDQPEPLWSGRTRVRKAFVSISDARDATAPVRGPALSDEELGGPFTARGLRTVRACTHTWGSRLPAEGPLRTG